MKNLHKRNYIKNFGKLIAIVLLCSLFTIVSCNGKDAEDKNKAVTESTESQSSEVTEKTELPKQTENNQSTKSTEVYENIEVITPPPKGAEGVSVIVPQIRLTQTKTDFSNFKNGLKFERENNAPTAHKKYLSDKFVFQAVPMKNFDTEKTAVVGSYVCKFYPLVELKTDDDLSKLGDGTPIPFATVLPIYEKVRNEQRKGNSSGEFFEFEDNFNYFYKTNWNGKDGLVFGADLEGLDFPVKKNYILSLKYQYAGSPTKFYPILGSVDLEPNVVQRLEKERLAFQNVNEWEYYLHRESPDDMISLYQEQTAKDVDDQTVFITTDLMAHSRHLIFDRTIQYVEENNFFPKIKKLIDAFLVELNKVNTEGNITANDETLEKAKLYFLTAKAIIELCPTEVNKTNEIGFIEKEYMAQNKSEVLSKYPTSVQEEIADINDASTFKQSALFTFADGSSTKEDYTQYKPRGHYTKNPILETYFKVMMLFGRAHFLITAPDGNQALAQNMTPIALLFTELVKNNTELYNQWADIFTPLTTLIGSSDDLSFDEVLPLWKSYKVENFKEWSANKENIIAFMKEAHTKLKSPAIAGTSVLYTASEKNTKPPMGWRLFGQRYTFDSFIHNLTSAPQLKNRMMVSGLDVMKVFSSKTADTYLKDEYNTFPELNTILTDLENKFLKYPEQVLGKTYYGTVLNEIALQASFDQGSGFYFTESPAWGKKSLITAHGSWAELRHDTILYSKPTAVSEMGGCGGESVTVRTEPIPKPVHYIEPNLAFWKNASMSTQLLLNTLNSYHLINDDIENKLIELINICQKATKIVELEINDRPVSSDDLFWISKMPYLLAPLILIGDLSGYIPKEDLQMALVVDVFTNLQSGKVLKTAVGIPYRIYVPLNDKQGGKRIAIGYFFNYYEFEQSPEYSFNNAEWKKRVYEQNNSNSNLEYLKPKWAKNISIPKN